MIFWLWNWLHNLLNYYGTRIIFVLNCFHWVCLAHGIRKISPFIEKRGWQIVQSAESLPLRPEKFKAFIWPT
jgi:hypothetical protein